MTNNKYIGNRYIPKLFNDGQGGCEWSKDSFYESLMVVMYQGSSYTSKQAVPKGIDIFNTLFWVRSADYNAQLTIYREDVEKYHQFVLDEIQAINLSFDEFKENETDNFINYKNMINTSYNLKSNLFLSKILNYKPTDESISILQGFCIVGNYLIFAMISSDETKATICKYDISSSTIISTTTLNNLKHANDMCYVPSKNLIYIVTDGSCNIITLDATTLAYKGTVVFPIGVGAIGFDKINNQFCVRNYMESTFYIIDINLNIVSSFVKSSLQTEQGLLFNNGIIFMCYFEAGTDAYGQMVYNESAKDMSAIVAYDINGEWLKTWYLGALGELESLEIYNNELILGFNPNMGQCKEFYKAEFKNNELNLNTFSPQQVQDSTPLKYSGNAITIYVDTSNNKIGNGTISNPFTSLRDAISFMYNYKIGADYTLNIKGDFTDEGNICIAGFPKTISLYGNNNAIIQSLILDGCSLVKVDSCIFNDVSTNSISLYNNGSRVDVRNCTFNNTKSIPKAYAIKCYDGELFLPSNSLNTFTNYEYPIYGWQTKAFYHNAQSFNNCINNPWFDSSIVKTDTLIKTNITMTNSQFNDCIDTIIGNASMQCTTDSPIVTQVITIPNAKSILSVIPIVQTSDPTTCKVSISNITSNTFTLYFNRSDTVETNVNWIAKVKYN